MNRARALLIAGTGLVAVAAFAAGRSSTELAEIPLSGGVVKFFIDEDELGRHGGIYVHDRHSVDRIYMRATPAALREIAKAATDAAAELEK